MKRTRLRILILTLLGCLALWPVLLGVAYLYRDEDEYAVVEPGLYIGAYVVEPPPGTDAVLNLGEVRDTYECAVHLWRPIRDGAPAPSIDWLRRQVEFLETQRQARRTTFVHCVSGRSRSGLVVVAYQMYRHGSTRDQALDFVRSRRPAVRPNPAFMELLEEWQRVLREQPPRTLRGPHERYA